MKLGGSPLHHPHPTAAGGRARPGFGPEWPRPAQARGSAGLPWTWNAPRLPAAGRGGLAAPRGGSAEVCSAATRLSLQGHSVHGALATWHSAARLEYGMALCSGSSCLRMASSISALPKPSLVLVLRSVGWHSGSDSAGLDCWGSMVGAGLWPPWFQKTCSHACLCHEGWRCRHRVSPDSVKAASLPMLGGGFHRHCTPSRGPSRRGREGGRPRLPTEAAGGRRRSGASRAGGV